MRKGLVVTLHGVDYRCRPTVPRQMLADLRAALKGVKATTDIGDLVDKIDVFKRFVAAALQPTHADHFSAAVDAGTVGVLDITDLALAINSQTTTTGLIRS